MATLTQRRLGSPGHAHESVRGCRRAGPFDQARVPPRCSALRPHYGLATHGCAPGTPVRGETLQWPRARVRPQSSWAYADLRAKIAYKAAMAGVVVVFVDPHYTSQTCSQCGHCERANRRSQSSFLCRRCGFAAHADWNAALNIRARGRAAVNLPDIPRCGVSNAAGTSPQALAVGR
jgi:predicted RNA-binding Zn-ribbon protein involved in translation (DUF1610 family)